MKAGIIQVSAELLAAMLHLPEGSRILHITIGDRPGHGRYFEVMVEADSMPEVPDGAMIPVVTLEYTRSVTGVAISKVTVVEE